MKGLFAERRGQANLASQVLDETTRNGLQTISSPTLPIGNGGYSE